MIRWFENEPGVLLVLDNPEQMHKRHLSHLRHPYGTLPTGQSRQETFSALANLSRPFLPGSIFVRRDLAPFIQGPHEVSRIFNLNGRVHLMHNVRHIRNCPPSEEVFLKQMSVHSVSSFPNLMKPNFERCTMGLSPPTKCIMRNPMFGKSAIN